MTEKRGPTSAEVGVAAGAEDAEEAGLQGVAGVVAGDVSKFLGEQPKVKREAGAQAIVEKSKDVRQLFLGQPVPNTLLQREWPLMSRKIAFSGPKKSFHIHGCEGAQLHAHTLPLRKDVFRFL